MTRGGIYGEIYAEHKGNPDSGAQGKSGKQRQRDFQGLRLYFIVYPDLSDNRDNIIF